jgi:hypothetical protein
MAHLEMKKLCLYRQEQIDEFRLEKTDPQLFSQLNGKI